MRPLLLLLLLLVISDLALAQRGSRGRSRWSDTTARPWSAELNVRSAILLDDEVVYAGGRLSHQVAPWLTMGISATVLLEEGTRRTIDRMETIELLGFIGPAIEISDTLRGRVDWFVGVTGGAGLIRQRTTGQETERVVDGLLLAAEPEVGLIVRASRRLRFRISTSGFLGRNMRTDSLVYGGPAASFALRWAW